MRSIGPVILFVLVSACGNWPVLPASGPGESVDWPALLPIEDIGAPPEDPDRQEAIEALRVRADGLRSRANILRRPVEDDEAMERLRRSLAR